MADLGPKGPQGAQGAQGALGALFTGDFPIALRGLLGGAREGRGPGPTSTPYLHPMSGLHPLLGMHPMSGMDPLLDMPQCQAWILY